jgi:hypothetical protein
MSTGNGASSDNCASTDTDTDTDTDNCGPGALAPDRLDLS